MPIDPKIIQELRDNTLESLDIKQLVSSDKLYEEDANILLDALKGNTSLRKLSIDGLRLDTLSYETLNKILPSITRLRRLSLDYYHQSYIEFFFHTNPHLQELYISGSNNALGSGIYANILSALKTHNLKTLSLCDITFSNEQTEQLAEVLKTNTSLLSLTLGNCKIANNGVQLLADALNTNQTLQHFDLRVKDHMHASELTHLDQALNNNFSLVKIRLPNKPSSIIQELIDRNSEIQAEFDHAITEGDFIKIQQLLSKKVPINLRINSKTALQKAILIGYEDVIKFLIENGADPNLTDEHDNTSLHLAAMLGYGERIIRLLIINGARLDICNAAGLTPYQAAAACFSLSRESTQETSRKQFEQITGIGKESSDYKTLVENRQSQQPHRRLKQTAAEVERIKQEQERAVLTLLQSHSSKPRLIDFETQQESHNKVIREKTFQLEQTKLQTSAENTKKTLSETAALIKRVKEKAKAHGDNAQKVSEFESLKGQVKTLTIEKQQKESEIARLQKELKDEKKLAKVKEESWKKDLDVEQKTNIALKNDILKLEAKLKKQVTESDIQQKILDEQLKTQVHELTFFKANSSKNIFAAIINHDAKALNQFISINTETKALKGMSFITVIDAVDTDKQNVLRNKGAILSIDQLAKDADNYLASFSGKQEERHCLKYLREGIQLLLSQWQQKILQNMAAAEQLHQEALEILKKLYQNDQLPESLTKITIDLINANKKLVFHQWMENTLVSEYAKKLDNFIAERFWSRWKTEESQDNPSVPQLIKNTQAILLQKILDNSLKNFKELQDVLIASIMKAFKQDKLNKILSDKIAKYLLSSASNQDKGYWELNVKQAIQQFLQKINDEKEKLEESILFALAEHIDMAKLQLDPNLRYETEIAAAHLLCTQLKANNDSLNHLLKVVLKQEIENMIFHSKPTNSQIADALKTILNLWHEASLTVEEKNYLQQQLTSNWQKRIALLDKCLHSSENTHRQKLVEEMSLETDKNLSL